MLGPEKNDVLTAMRDEQKKDFAGKKEGKLLFALARNYDSGSGGGGIEWESQRNLEFPRFGDTERKKSPFFLAFSKELKVSSYKSSPLEIQWRKVPSFGEGEKSQTNGSADPPPPVSPKGGRRGL